MLDPEICQILVCHHAYLWGSCPAVIALWARRGRLAFMMLTAEFFRLVDLKIDPGILFGANRLKKNAESTGGLALAADDVAHVFLIDVERNEHAAVIHGAFGSDILGVIHEGLNDVLYELLILLKFSHSDANR